MAIINCPHCGKPTSSVAKTCRACAQSFSGADPEQQARLERRARRKHVRNLSLQAVFATLLGVAGGLWLMFGDAPRENELARLIAGLMLVIGLVWYLYVRARLWLRKNR